MFIYEMFIIGVGQAGSGPKEDVIEILSPWEEEGKRGMQGICVEQVEQVARLKRLPLTERGRSHPPLHRSQCPQDPIPWVGMQIQTKPPGRSRLQPQSQLSVWPCLCLQFTRRSGEVLHNGSVYRKILRRPTEPPLGVCWFMMAQGPLLLGAQSGAWTLCQPLSWGS